MAQIDQMPEFRAKLPHSTHDLSHDYVFTATTAHLLPVFHTIVDAGDSVQLGFDFSLRTQPLLAASFEDIDVHVEYFFVPMFLLYQPFGSLYYQVNDEFSSNFTVKGNMTDGRFPVLDFPDLLSDVYGNRTVFPLNTGGAFGDCFGLMAYRLLDHLHFNASSSFFSGSPWQPNVFPYQLLAYHCIYQYCYRLDNREPFKSTTFNWDRFFGNSLVSSDDMTGQDVLDLFTLHYRPKTNDYFTDVKVSPIVDILNLSTNQLSVTNDWLSRPDISGLPVMRSGSQGTSQNPGLSSARGDAANYVQTQFGFSALTSSSSPVNGQDISTANLRALFANEKLWSITGRARKHYDDQVLAHLGFQVPHDIKHEVSRFGHDVTQIHIGEVISTAQTDQADLGEIAGKGYARLNSKTHTFKVPCHGVVMAIFSVAPRLRYGLTFGKENAVASRFDLPIPEYDHLGMQPLFGYEFNPNGSENYDIFGWQYRYEQWKRRYNRVSGAFTRSGSLDSWAVDSYPYPADLLSSQVNVASFQSFIYLPDQLNQIFLGQYDGSWKDVYEQDASMIYDNDPFVVNGHVNCKLRSWMSDYSLPRLDA